MAEGQQAHNNWMEKCGQIFGLVITLVSLALGGYLVANDKALWGAAACLSPLAYLVGQFIWKQRRAERKKRPKPVPVAEPPEHS